MKKIILFLLLTFVFINITAQETNYKVGDDIEYFDGLNWLDSKIVQVGGNGQFLVYTNKAQTTTKWFKADDLQPLFKEAITITEKKVEIIETTVMPLYHVGDIVKYNDGSMMIETSIMNLGPNYTYQIFADNTNSSTLWKNEKDLILVSSTFDKSNNSTKESSVIYKLNEFIEYLENNFWTKGTIAEINESGMYKVVGSSRWYNTDEIRKIDGQIQQVATHKFSVGEKVKINDGNGLIDSEIIEIGENNYYQVYFNVEKTKTTWVEEKEIQK